MINLLIIEDCEGQRKLVRQILLSKFQELEIEATIYEADCLEAGIAQAKGCDLVLLDLELVTTTKKETIECIKAFDSIPIVVVSGFNDFETIKKCILNGVDSYICKEDVAKQPCLFANLVLQAVWRSEMKTNGASRYKLQISG